MPQGLPKKIEVELLLRNLALQLRHSTPCQFFHRPGAAAQPGQNPTLAPCSPAGPSKRLQPIGLSPTSPVVQPATVDPQVPGNRRYLFPGSHPPHGRLLE